MLGVYWAMQGQQGADLVVTITHAKMDEMIGSHLNAGPRYT